MPIPIPPSDGGTGLDLADRIRLTIEESPEAVFWLERSGRFVFVNRRACESLGYDRAELTRLFLWDIDPDFPPERWAVQWETMRTAGRSTFETRHRDSNGRIFPVEVCATQVVHRGAEFHISFVRDISERVALRAAREKLEGQLRQSQRLEAVGRLAGGVAHDFNNMLSVILGYAEQLAADHPEGDLHADVLEIERAARRSAALVRQLLAFARRQPIDPRPLDLSAAVADLLKMLRRLLGEDLELAWMPAEEPVLVKMDPSQLDQILANLCINARDAISDSGKVTIETGRTVFDEARCADHPDTRPGRYAVLAVSDDGAGMDAETRERIFEPFFTTKPGTQGTGLGLATVWGIVKQNDGHVQVYSEPGHGTTFRIYLPEIEAAGVRQAPMTGAPARGSETLLLVEDETAILTLCSRMLRSLGYRVLEARDPDAALRLSAEETGAVDLLLTDVVMPGLNGRELAQRLQADRPALRTLFMSGYTANVIAHHGVLDPDVCFLAKPFTVQQLAAAVRSALDGSGEAAR